VVDIAVATFYLVVVQQIVVQQNKNILVVDDDPQLRILMQAFLERSGYRVLVSADGRESLDIVRRDPAGIGLAVVDLTLPDMQGDAVALEMLGINPGLRILICSGYPYEVEALPQEHRAKFGQLQKPFLPKDLIESVESLFRT